MVVFILGFPRALQAFTAISISKLQLELLSNTKTDAQFEAQMQKIRSQSSHLSFLKCPFFPKKIAKQCTHVLNRAVVSIYKSKKKKVKKGTL